MHTVAKVSPQTSFRRRIVERLFIAWNTESHDMRKFFAGDTIRLLDVDKGRAIFVIDRPGWNDSDLLSPGQPRWTTFATIVDACTEEC